MAALADGPVRQDFLGTQAPEDPTEGSQMGMSISSSRAAAPMVSQAVNVRPPVAPAPAAPAETGNVQALSLATSGNAGTMLNINVK